MVVVSIDYCLWILLVFGVGVGGVVGWYGSGWCWWMDRCSFPQLPAYLSFLFWREVA